MSLKLEDLIVLLFISYVKARHIGNALCICLPLAAAASGNFDWRKVAVSHLCTLGQHYLSFLHVLLVRGVTSTGLLIKKRQSLAFVLGILLMESSKDRKEVIL